MIPGAAELEFLPIPALVIHGERVAHANGAFLETFGFTSEAIVDRPVERLIDAFAATDDVAYLHQQLIRHERRQLWFTFSSPTGERTVNVRGAPWHGDEARLVLFFEEGVRGTAPAFFRALSEAAVQLVRSTSEDEVLEHAAQALHGQGLNVWIYRLEGEVIRLASVHAAPGLVEAHARVSGRPVVGSAVPARFGRALREVLRTGRGWYRQDLGAFVEELYPAEDRQQLREGTGGARGLQAPIWVDEAPYGVLAADSDDLTPTDAGAIHLFSQLVGRAVENVRLHRAAAERLEELARLQRENVERERLAALGRAAQVMAHEVRNPLGVILNTTTLLKRADALEPAVREQTLAVLQEEVSRIDQIIRDLLDLGRPLTPHRRPFDLADLAARALDRLAPQLEARQIRPALIADPRPCVVEGDEELLELAVRNLVRNALQSSPVGGEVRVRIVCEEGAPLLSVEDDGAGIPADVRPHVFEPFFTTRATGTGLGLAFVKRIADVHDLAVRVAEVDQGTRFELVFPAGAPAA